VNLIIADKDRPDRQITLTAEGVKRFRQTLLEEYAASGADASQISRRNPLIVRPMFAVEKLNRACFDWGQELTAEEKRGSVIWMARALKKLKSRYANPNPMFVEVF
jgi:hypothetical protein